MDANDWTTWLHQHLPGFVLAARQWVPDHSAAEDVVQNALVRFWPNRTRANDPLAVLYIAVKREALQWHRAATRLHRRETAAARSEIAPDSLFTQIESDERREQIEAALKDLPDPQREVLIMKIWIGLTYPQIADALTITQDTVASRYRYALDKLRASLPKEVYP